MGSFAVTEFYLNSVCQAVEKLTDLSFGLNLLNIMLNRASMSWQV